MSIYVAVDVDVDLDVDGDVDVAQIGALQHWQRNGKTSVACGAASRWAEHVQHNDDDDDDEDEDDDDDDDANEWWILHFLTLPNRSLGSHFLSACINKIIISTNGCTCKDHHLWHGKIISGNSYQDHQG